ncbi:S28 family serine protease [Bacteroidota bacterium]
MKKIIMICFWIILPLSTAHAVSSLEEFLKELKVKDIRILEKEAFYSKIFEVSFTQPIDHRNPDLGSFDQRLYISHYSVDAPVVLVTEGYSADYYYTSEPASLLKCNQIICEHRFFGESAPDSIPWEYLTTWQAATDHHEIIQKFKSYYTGDWITTGISKGGQTTMYHSYYYPEDVKLKIPYVAPLNAGIEDTRIYEFLDDVGNWNCRRKIHNFQKCCLKNQDDLIPEFIEFSKMKGYTYDWVGGYEKAFEYCVLEYSFAFWQWQYSSCKDFPNKNASPEEVIRHLNLVGGFDYFADQFVKPYQPFFYQSYTEMGYYGYELDDFKHYLKHVSEPGFQYTLPEEAEIKFNPELYQKMEEYFKSDAENFIFIYGEYDTWSATAVDLGTNTASTVVYKKKGSHRTRIRNLPEDQQDYVKQLMEEYLLN